MALDWGDFSWSMTRWLRTTPVKAVQNVTADTNNSSTTNLTAANSYTFTGTASTTLGVAGLQVSLFADKNCVVKVQQSPDGTYWDLSDSYTYTASGNFGITVQAISSYVRVLVTTNNETTTTFRLQTALCPTVEAVPRSLDPNGHFKVTNGHDEYGWESENTPMGEIRVAQMTRLVGANFEGGTIDPRFWTAAAAGTAATIAQANAQVLITSGTSSAATVTIFSTRRARYVSGVGMRYRSVMQLGDAGTANSVRRWGIGWGSTAMPAVTDGAWFQVSGTTFGVVTMKGSTPTVVTSMNGTLGPTYVPTTGVTTYEIYWTNSKVYFVIGGSLLHTVSASAATWAATMNHHVFMDSVNGSTLGGSVTLACRVASIHRMGQLSTNPQYYNLTGNAATHTLKLGPGFLHRIICNNTSGTSYIIYDQTTAAVPIIGTITTVTASLGSWEYQCPFFNGLVIKTTGNDLDMTVVYE